MPGRHEARLLVLLIAAAVAGTTALAALLGSRRHAPSKKRGLERRRRGSSSTQEREDGDALTQLRAQVHQLEEMGEEVQEALRLHQQQTAAVLGPLQREVASLKQQLEILHFAAAGQRSMPASSATAAAAAAAATAIAATPPRRQSTRGRGGGSGSDDSDDGAGVQLKGGAEEEELLRMSQSHLATVAMALGVASPGCKGTGGGSGGMQTPAPTPRDGGGYNIISDWTDFH